MLVLSGLLLGLIGPAYVIAAAALAVLALGQLAHAALSCKDVLLVMMGHGSILRRLNLLQLVVCVGLSAMLIPLYGIMGAAVAAMLTVCRVLPAAF